MHSNLSVSLAKAREAGRHVASLQDGATQWLNKSHYQDWIQHPFPLISPSKLFTVELKEHSSVTYFKS